MTLYQACLAGMSQMCHATKHELQPLALSLWPFEKQILLNGLIHRALL